MSRASNYQKLCSLAIYHEYYNSTIRSDEMKLHVDLTNRQICKNEGITLKLTDRDISVLYEKAEEGNAADQNAGEDIIINFGISFNQPDFFSFTTSGLNQIDRVLLCSNETTRKGSELATGLQYLHDGEFVDVTHLQYAKNFGSTQFTRDISLIIALNLKTLVAQVYDDTSAIIVPVVRYVVRFAAREAHWLYWFWLKQGKLKNLIETEDDFEKLDVHLHDEFSTDTEIRFKHLDYVHSNNNQTGVRFMSLQPLKLGALSDFTLSLSCQSDMGNKMLVEQLPHPGKDCLEILRVDDSNQIVASSHVSL